MASAAFHQAHPTAHRTSSYPEDPRRFGLRKAILHRLNHSSSKVFLTLCRQRASILFSHAKTLAHHSQNVIYIMLRLVTLSTHLRI